jgi:DNA (cytosine-5)-methyltransferase 3A
MGTIYKILNTKNSKIYIGQTVNSAKCRFKKHISQINCKNVCSALVSAQNRDRFYWSNIRTKQIGLFDELYTDIPQPEDKGILLRDILQPESEVDKKYWLDGNMLTWWNKNKDFQLRKKYSQLDGEKAICLTARGYASWNGNYITHNLQQRNGKGQGGKGHLQKIDQKSYCLDTKNNQAIESNDDLRRLTPIECSRLQTIPSWYKWECSDSQIYKMLGNGWTSAVIEWIFGFMETDS